MDTCIIAKMNPILSCPTEPASHLHDASGSHHVPRASVPRHPPPSRLFFLFPTHLLPISAAASLSFLCLASGGDGVQGGVRLRVQGHAHQGQRHGEVEPAVCTGMSSLQPGDLFYQRPWFPTKIDSVDDKLFQAPATTSFVSSLVTILYSSITTTSIMRLT